MSSPPDDISLLPPESTNMMSNIRRFIRSLITRNSDELQASRKYKLTLSFSMYYCYMAFGLVNAMMGPALIDLAELLDATVPVLSVAFTYASVSYLFGAITCGYIFSKINRQICFAVAVLILAITRVVIVSVPTVEVFYASSAATGFVAAGIDIACNAWLLEIWSRDAGPYMQALHFSYAVGAILAPITVKPFISPDVNGTNVTHLMDATQIGTRIHIPFLFAAGVVASASLVIVFLYLMVPYRELRGVRDQASHATPAVTSDAIQYERLEQNSNETPDVDVVNPGKRDRIIYMLSIALASLILCFSCGAEINTLNFLTTFIEAKGFGKVTGVDINTAYLGSFTVGRGLSILMATLLSNSSLLFISLTLIGSANVLFTIFRNSDLLWVWISMCVLGLGQAATYPATLSYVEENLTVTTRISGIFMFISAFMTSINPMIIGRLVQSAPNIFIWFNLGCFLFAAAFFLSFHSLILYKKNLSEKRIMSKRHA